MPDGLVLRTNVLSFPTDPARDSVLYEPHDGKQHDKVRVEEPHIRELHKADVSKGTTIRGYMHFPQLDADSPCRNLTQVPPHTSIPDDDLITWRPYVLGLAPWDPACNKEFLTAASNDGAAIEGFVFYTPDHPDELPDSKSDYWKGTKLKDYKFPIFAIRGSDGVELMKTYLEYALPNKTVPFGPGHTARARLYAKIDTGPPEALPGLWMFLLIVLGVLVVMIGCTSLAMHTIQYRRRQSLRRRVANGEVDLEALGIKRLVLPRKILDKIPLRTYVSSSRSPRDSSPAPLSRSPKPTAPPSPPPETPRTSIYAAPDPPLPPSPTLTPTRHSDSDPLPPNSALYDQPSCSICLDDFVSHITTVRELPCGHIFHPGCIDSFLENQSALCPLCKKSTLPKGYVPPQLNNATVRRERQMRRRARRRERGGFGRLEALFQRLGLIRRVERPDSVEMHNSASMRQAEAGEVGRESGETARDERSVGSGKWRRAVSAVFPGFR